MADWEYKEDTYTGTERARIKSGYSDKIKGKEVSIATTFYGRGYRVTQGKEKGNVKEVSFGYDIDQTVFIFDPPRSRKMQGILKEDAAKAIRSFNAKHIWDFPTWLGKHSKGGWEIFKISRDFTGGGGTWCIFRRKVE